LTRTPPTERVELAPEAQAALEARAPWCRVCCTAHDGARTCPGELRATGPERFGWRVRVQTRRGLRESYGTLVAPVGERWRARILTYPSALWILPHGGALKFAGPSPEEVERQAIELIKLHCRLRRSVVLSELPPLDAGPIDPEQAPHVRDSPEVQAAQRRPRVFPVRFGAGRPSAAGLTGDLSEGGMFIHTDAALRPGTELHVHLEAEGFGIPLRGVVQWARSTDEPGRLRGMGLRLTHSHPRYVRLLREIAARDAGADPAGPPPPSSVS
jgi:hypothetical protein